MRHSFVWVIPEATVRFMSANGGVSPCYTLPLIDLPGADSIPGSRVYIVARAGRRDLVFARVIVDSVERCEDEAANVLGHLLNIDVGSSCRFIRGCNDVNAIDYETKLFDEMSLSFAPISVEVADELDSLLNSRVNRLLKHYSDREFSRISPPINHCNSAYADMVLIREIALQFPMSELWGNQHIGNPVANLAIEYLKKHPEFVSSGSAEEVIERLSALPPLTSSGIHVPRRSKKGIVTSAPTMPNVDLSLMPIVPQNVKVRKFVARRTSISVDSVLQKTESAEKRHQEMLKDIATFLLSKGENVFQSESIDMAMRSKDGLLVFELKSTNENNIVSQIAKGLFQLLYYSDALAQCGVTVAGKGLIIEANLTPEMVDVFSRLLANAGMVLYLYDMRNAWPRRVTPELMPTADTMVTDGYRLSAIDDYAEAASKGDSKKMEGDGYDA